MSEVKELKLSTKIEIQQKEELKKMGIKKRREEVERRLQMSKTILAQSAKDIFQKILRPEPAWSPDKMKAEANKKRKELFNLFSTICVEVGIDLHETTMTSQMDC